MMIRGGRCTVMFTACVAYPLGCMYVYNVCGTRRIRRYIRRIAYNTMDIYIIQVNIYGLFVFARSAERVDPFGSVNNNYDRVL